MKKFIILLLAALMIVGLGVSCKPDPEPDAFKGTWTGKDSDDWEYTVVCDGFGKVTYSVKHGKIDSFEGTYKAAEGYITLTYKEEVDPVVSYLYAHLVTASDISDYHLPSTMEGKYIFHQDEESTACAFPNDYDQDEDFIYQFTKEGDEYSAVAINPDYKQYVAFAGMKVAASTATLTDSMAVYDGDYDPEDVPELLCSQTITAELKCTAGGTEDPWDYKLEDCTETTIDLKAKYKLTSTALTIYNDDGEELVLTKQ